MTNELQPCPFCEGNLIEFGSDAEGDKIVKLYIHPELSDEVNRCPLTRLVFKADSWQRRPIEDAMRTQIKDLNVRLGIAEERLEEADANGPYMNIL